MRECPRCARCYDDEVVDCPDDQANTKNTLPGTTLLNGRYRLEKRLGRGAMGQVYLASDENLRSRRVAVKTIRPDVLSDENVQEGEAIARFERAARIAASIQHPNVIGVTDFGKSEEGVFFLVMEYVEGDTLHQLLRREGTLSLQRTIRILEQICAGVEAAHDEGVLHRDLKPANVFIFRRSKGQAATEDVKIGDFAVAMMAPSAAGLSSGAGSAERGIVGTPEYVAPEQMHADTALDARADIYALGTIAYQMLAGRPPFVGEIMQIFSQKLTQEPPLLSTLRSDIPPKVEEAIMHALEREPDNRPSTVVDWYEELAGAANAGDDKGESRLIILGPIGAEVFIDDERHGSVGRAGRLVLTSIPPGQHVLRITHAGEDVDERVIEVRPDADEQIIQAQFRRPPPINLPPSKGGSLGREPSGTPDIVACINCGARFASGIKFCGRCGGMSFRPVTADGSGDRETVSPGVDAAERDVACTNCGTRFPAGTKFCGRCGKSTFRRVKPDGSLEESAESESFRFSSMEPLPVEVAEDERRLHVDARRFARLLASEINLYNKEKVNEGRIASNIYDQLREDIDRSREMYDKRVAPSVTARYDYFHHELVASLAEGDPSKLGRSYPGPVAVEASPAPNLDVDPLTTASSKTKDLDFKITIKEGSAGEHRVRAESGGETAQTLFTNPFQDIRDVIRSTITRAVLSSAAGRISETKEIRDIKSIGAELFRSVINGPVKNLYERCRNQSASLRLRLNLDQSVEDLPWEFLCQNEDFIALRHGSIVRYIETLQPVSLIRTEHPLRILVVIANPSDEIPLDTAAEKDAITAALKPLADDGLVQLEFIEGDSTWKKLTYALLSNRPHILHFIGHSTIDRNGEGVLAMEDSDRRTMLVDSERLAVLLQGESRLGLVVLNSCLGSGDDDGRPALSLAASLVKSGLPAVVAMQYGISDQSARVIAETFYASLASNAPVDVALTEARRRIFLWDRNSLEWAAPILYMRAPLGVLFAIKERQPVAKRKAQELEQRAEEWWNAKRDASLLLDPGELADAQSWMRTDAAAIGYSTNLYALVQASEAAIQHEEARKATVAGGVADEALEEDAATEPKSSPRIFISYRRNDASGHAGRLYDNLAARFGPEQVSIDIRDISPGEDFVTAIERVVSSSDVMLVVIGRNWLSDAGQDGLRRLDNPSDFIRTEIATALQLNLRVIPVLVQEATMPGPDELPDEIRALSYRNAAALSDSSWRQDVERLCEDLERFSSRRESSDPPIADADSKEPAQEFESTPGPRFLRDFEHDVVISYAHADNQTLIEGQRGWVDVFHQALDRRLQIHLGRQANLWRDPQIQGSDDFKDTLLEEIPKAAIFISVLSPSYINSEWCRRELQEFVRPASETGGVRLGNKSRIFKVEKIAVPPERQPVELQGMTGYEFYYFENGRVRELSAESGTHAKQYWQLIDDVAQDIATLLQEMKKRHVADDGLDDAIIARLSASSQEALLMAEGLRAKAASDLLNTAHLLAGLYLESGGPTNQLLTIFEDPTTVDSKLEVFLSRLGPKFVEEIKNTSPANLGTLKDLKLSPHTREILTKASELSSKGGSGIDGSSPIESRHLLAGLLTTKKSAATQWVAAHVGVEQATLYDATINSADFLPPLDLIRSLSKRVPGLSPTEALARIHFVRGDLLDLKVDAIVNAVASDPFGGSTLESRILSTLGTEVTASLSGKLLKPGETIVNDLGSRWPFRYLIHSCSGISDLSESPATVTQAVNGALKEENALGLKSLALAIVLPPARTPDPDVRMASALVVMDSVLDHFKAGSRLEKVVFTFAEKDRLQYQAFLDAFNSRNGELSVRVLTPFLSTSSRHALGLAEALRVHRNRARVSSSDLLWALYQKETSATGELLRAIASPEQISSRFQERLGKNSPIPPLTPVADHELCDLELTPNCEGALVSAASLARGAQVIRERQLLAGLLSNPAADGTRGIVELSGIAADQLAAIVTVTGEDKGEPIGPQIQKLREATTRVQVQPWIVSLSEPMIDGKPAREIRVEETITLTLSLLEAMPGDEAKHNILLIPESTSELTGFITASGFHLHDSNRFTIQTFNCEPLSRSRTIELTAKLSGERSIEIELYPGSRSTGLPPSAVTRRVKVATPVVLPDIKELIDRREIPNPQPDVMMYVALEETPDGQHTRIYLTCYALGLDRERLKPLPLNREDLLALRTAAIRTAASSSHLSPADTLAAQRACGAMLFKKLMTKELGDYYLNICRAAGSSTWTWLIISDDNASIPWELVCASDFVEETGSRWYDNFFGDRFVVANWIGRRGLRLFNEAPLGWVDLIHYNQRSSDLPVWRSVIGNEYVEVEDEPGRLSLLQPGSNCYGIHVLRYSDQRRSGQIVSVEENGGAAVERSQARDMTQAQRLDLTLRRPTVGLSFVTDSAPADASTFARADTQLETNWMLPLIQAGATALVGPRWPVSPEADQVFTREFYNAVREGYELGLAAWMARREVHAAFPHRPDWLAYAYFGHPKCEPYTVRKAEGFTLVEAMNHPDNAPFQTDKTYQFRASFRAEAPTWFEGRLRIQQEELFTEDMTVMVLPLNGDQPTTVKLDPIGGTNDVQCKFDLTMPDQPTIMPVMVRFQKHNEELRTVMLQLQVTDRA